MKRLRAPGGQALYAIAVVALYAVVAALRWDLAVEQLRIVAWAWQRGGVPAATVAGLAVGLAAILAFVTWTIARRPEPGRDLPLVVLATLLGWAAETWGTRTGLWEYYTGEAPPAWIVPAWPLGALVVHRVARWRIVPLVPAPWVGRVWVAIAVVTVGYFAAFVRPAWSSPWTAAAFVVVLAPFVLWPRPNRDVPVFLAGLACVFLADFWGTSSDCYRYYTHTGGERAGQAAGVLYGMLFDTTIVLAAGRAASWLRPSRDVPAPAGTGHPDASSRSRATSTAPPSSSR